METIWTILGAISLALLIYYWGGKNAVWGGLSFGIAISLIVSIFVGFTWFLVLKGAIIGVLAGFLAELLGKLSDSLSG